MILPFKRIVNSFFENLDNIKIYSFINKGDICILRPDDVYHLSEEGTGGKFIYKTEDEQIPC